eukprot:CAMPEP_0182440134 /NCGR_PEP_ID=MMETSP1167-20130531/86862_1 /TAXON_ID=2988 /ORGANISM="Mallomonas Sp, Strain CCMP3275" /LENGTH=315 /DNA_ID=CAMNT_0024634001 /DNA_START=221 /DNA_END=1168 /DNA_ORIENTATION=-
MKWAFGKGAGSLQEMGVVGSEGEYYFHPSRPATLKAPVPLGKTVGVPIFPFNNVLTPIGTESIQVLEMHNRQLFNDVGDGLFGFAYLNPQAQKLALVGTLARIKHRKVLEDGRAFIVVEGVKRFYLKEFVSDKPYIKARIQTFEDYSEAEERELDELEQTIFEEVRFNVKLMELLLPQKRYSLASAILENRPPMRLQGVRNIVLGSEETELKRRSRFSYAILDMLQIKPSVKLMLLQEPVIEKRYLRLLKVLEKGSENLKQELRTRGVLTELGIRSLREDILSDTSYVTQLEVTSKNIIPENYVDNSWVQRPTMM